MFVVVLMNFYVYKLVYKFWGRIWDQRNHKWEFWVIGSFQEGTTKTGLPVLGNLLWRVAQEQTPMFWVFWALGDRSGPSKLILLMYLTVFEFSKPLETSIELY